MYKIVLLCVYDGCHLENVCVCVCMFKPVHTAVFLTCDGYWSFHLHTFCILQSNIFVPNALRSPADLFLQL